MSRLTSNILRFYTYHLHLLMSLPLETLAPSLPVSPVWGIEFPLLLFTLSLLLQSLVSYDHFSFQVLFMFCHLGPTCPFLSKVCTFVTLGCRGHRMVPYFLTRLNISMSPKLYMLILSHTVGVGRA